MLNLNFLDDKLFLKELENYPIKESSLKVELLDFQEHPITEIQGKCVSGSLNIDGNSSMRRTCSFSLVVDKDTYDLKNLNNLIAINRKIKLYIGQTNFLDNYKHYGEKVWFPLGIFVIVSPSISHGVADSTINISAKDKMCLLNGEVSGALPAPVTLHEKYTRREDGSTLVQAVAIYDIVRESVIELGGEDPGKVLINDVPLKIKKIIRYIGNKQLHFDSFGNEVEAPVSGGRSLSSGDLAGYDWVNFTFPGELIKQAGEPVTAILDSISNTLGNYEYFYDVNGNFVFQEKKNYLNTSYTPITKLENDNYIVNFCEPHTAYSFKNSNIISSYNNNPNWLNIKNDFIVWGSRKSPSGATLPIRYHVAIDEIPSVPAEYGDIPWQVYLYEYGKQAQEKATDAGYYYRELQNEIPKLYDFDKQKWKDLDPSSMDFYLDFINTDSELGKFSVGAIGRRTKVINDKDVTTLYRPPTPDYVILDVNNPELRGIILELNKKGQKFIVVSNRDAYSYAGIGKDAFSVIRENIMNHTSYSESISLTALPLYHLEPNVRIEVEDELSNIYGDYIINSISLPLTHEGTMSISAVRATNRI